jgi:glycosyltransferase involved in cell wall biosynthesis
MFTNLPKISVITINYNNSDGLNKTIQSVVSQSYNNIEYIVIDGGSCDDSKRIIENWGKQIDFWISEPDHGIYNAMNKGIAAATGEYLIFINSGDLLTHDRIIEQAVHQGMDQELVFGNIIYVGENLEREWIVDDELTFETFYKATIPHPSTFIKKSLFEMVGLYNEGNKIVSDWEFFMLAVCKYNCSYKHINLTIARFYLGGISSDPNNYDMLSREQSMALKKHFPLFLKDYERSEQTKEALRKVRNYVKMKKFIKGLLKREYKLNWPSFVNPVSSVSAHHVS